MEDRTMYMLGFLGLCLLTLLPSPCICEGEFDAGVGQQTTFGQKMDEETVKEQLAAAINTTEKRKFLYHTADDKPIAVYDKLFKGSTILTLRSYLTSLGQDSWLFNNYDPDHLNKQRASDNVPWVNYRDPTEFKRMLVSKTLVKAIKDLTGKEEKWYPYKVTGKVIRRGDHTKVVADSNEPGEFSALLYLNSKWRKNYYGELYFFDADKEIQNGVTPKAGRVVIWDSSILRLTRPPSVSFKQGQILLHITYSKSEQKMQDAHKQWLSFWNDRVEAKKTWYLPEYKESDEKPLVPNIADHVFANYSTLTGDKLFVFDNLFPEDLLHHMRSHVLKYGTYFFDDSIDDESDNVQWIAGLDMPMYLQSPYWKIIKAVATFASGSPEWFPYDVSTNLVRNADHTRIHLDTSGPEDQEWTFLVYLNPNWTQNNYGETAFFERNSDDTEIVAEVRPRFGRSVIFQGQIPHSARPPSLNFTGARLTFVTKLQQNEYHGRLKNMQEEFRHFQSHSSARQSLYAMSKTGNADKYLIKMKAIREQLSPAKAKAPADAQSQEPAGEDDSEEGAEEGQAEGAEGGQAEGAEGGQAEGAEGGQEEGAEGGQEGEEGAQSSPEGEMPSEGAGQAGEEPTQEGAPGEDEEEEEADPNVKHVQDEMADIVAKGEGSEERLANLYQEMKKRDAIYIAQMSEDFPLML